MDPITAGILTATVVPLASGAAGEAGRQAWGSLVALAGGPGVHDLRADHLRFG